MRAERIRPFLAERQQWGTGAATGKALKVPEGANALVWRVVLDPRIPDGFAQVHAAYDLDDLAHAVSLLEQMDRLNPPVPRG